MGKRAEIMKLLEILKCLHYRLYKSKLIWFQSKATVQGVQDQAKERTMVPKASKHGMLRNWSEQIPLLSSQFLFRLSVSSGFLGSVGPWACPAGKDDREESPQLGQSMA